MKVLALGGYGKVGLAASKLLAQSDLVSRIAVAGRTLERAEEAATAVGPRAVAIRADGTDEQALTALAAGYDLIMNASRSDTAIPAIRAAMHHGAHYCDAVTFGDSVQQVLFLASAARAAGTTAIAATGISPCISNLLGVYVARQLEEVEQLQVGRAEIFSFQTGRELTPRQWREDPIESVAALQEFKPFITWTLQRVQNEGIRRVLDHRQGGWVEVDPTQNGLDVPLLPAGTARSYPYFSGDDIWGQLPHDLSQLAPAEMNFSPFPPLLYEQLREHAQRVLRGEIDADTATSSFLDTVERDPHRWLTLPVEFDLLPKMWVRALGRKEGRPARCTCWLTDPMWDVNGYYLTSVALAVAARKVLRGEVQERGVLHAEKAFEPLAFFDEVVEILPEPPPDGKVIDETFEWLA